MLAYVWYGKKGQGIDIFHRRLKVDLAADLREQAHFIEITPEWPMELFEPERAFEDMLCEAFSTDEFEDIPQIIRARTRGTSGMQTLIYLRHRPVTTKMPINPKSLKLYLNWLDKHFIPKLEKRHFVLTAVSFEVAHANKFEKVIQREGLRSLQLSGAVFRPLDELKHLNINDLYDFLLTHKIRLPKGKQDKLLEDIMKQTDGHYRETISALQQLVRRAMIEEEESRDETDSSDEDLDY